MELRSTASINFFLALVAAIFALQAYQAVSTPLGSGEAYLYDRFVRPTARQALQEELPNRDVLYTILEKRSVGLFHVSPFSARLPGLLFSIPFLWSVWGLLGKRWLGLIGVAVAGALAFRWHWFSTANGFGTALALVALGLFLAGRYLTKSESPGALYLNLCGMCLGLAISAHSAAAPAALGVGIFVLFVMARQRRSLFMWTDRVLVTAAVTAFLFLVLPLSHAHAAAENPSELTHRQAVDLQHALDALRSVSGQTAIRIGASATAVPVINFYRAQHRASAWGRADRHLESGPFDYYLLDDPDAGLVDRRHLVVIYRDGDFVLARPSPASI